MIISGFLAESFQDWDKGLSSIVFTSHCNFRCPACYAKKLLNNEGIFKPDEILKKIYRKSGYIRNIVICGGEASIEDGLEEFLIQLKSKNFNVKLDTNGSNPDVLEELIHKGLIDYVAMDIKGPECLYNSIAGLKLNEAKDMITKKVERSLSILKNNISYELRTTIVPVFRNADEYSWLTTAECIDMAKWIYSLLNENKPHWYLQRFTAKSAPEMIDARLAKENLAQSYQETPDEILSDIKERALSLNYNFQIR